MTSLALLRLPTIRRALLGWGSLTQDGGEPLAALGKYRTAASASPHCAQVWNNVGLCFFDCREHTAAVACLKKAMSLEPLEWIIAYNLGLVCLAKGQDASAFRYLHTAVNLNPGFAASCMLLAVCLSRLGDHENASAAYERCLSLEVADHIAELNYAISLFNHGDETASAAHLRRHDQLVEGLSAREQDAATLDDQVLRQSSALRKALGLPLLEPP